MNRENIKITADQATEIISGHYHLNGQVLPVHGELDQNFRVIVNAEENYLLKISRSDADETHLDFQNELLLQLKKSREAILFPEVIKNKNGDLTSTFIDTQGNTRLVRLLAWIPGRLWNQVNPKRDELRHQLGQQAGLITKSLTDFNHACSERALEWDIAQSLWTCEHVNLFSGEEKELVSFYQKRFKTLQPEYLNLRKSVVHNDVNDHNIVVSNNLIDPEVMALFDYGDAIYTQVINDVAIACAYTIKEFVDPLAAALPLVSGYHETFPLLENELDHLYTAIAMRLIISLTKAEINRVAEPDNEYLQISKKSAMALLKQWRHVNEEFATYSFRQACGFDPHLVTQRFNQWAAEQSISLMDLFPGMNRTEICPLDLSVGSHWVGTVSESNDLELFDFKINKLQKQHPDKIIAGGYLEPRALYSAPEYDSLGNEGRRSRSVHLGIDYWLPAYTAVHAILDGKVIAAVENSGDKQYGGMLILEHTVQDSQGEFVFYSLYGHLTLASATRHKLGNILKQGECIAELGNYPENGNWSSHLHFQLMLSMLHFQNDFAGVAYPEQVEVWGSICPNPNLLFKCAGMELKQKNKSALIEYRKQHLGKGLSLQYQEAIKIVRGTGQYLLDEVGRKYLDTVNNVAHVGHEHPDVVRAGQEQMALLNTNSRYLHDNIVTLTRELLATLPDELSVIHYVNSGSEANELALRMLKTFTGQTDIIASEVGYHGNTNATIDISSYKFDGKGGLGTPEHTHIFPLPDKFRGKYRGENSGDLYAGEVQHCIDGIKAKGRKLAGMIVEPIISCGGQVVLPEGFLKLAYDYVRQEGGLCVSDEVQVGCGRLGKVYWGFQLHDVIPDIITIGKPLGNGHPVAAVVCTREVAERFANGMEYFNTFGGNPVSCAIGAEVLQVVKREKLQENALEIGELLKTRLKQLSGKYPVIGDVRGEGLFLGIELVDAKLNPMTQQTAYLVNRMKQHGILMSSDGPAHNVLKIKPPLVFDRNDAEELLFNLDKILSEDFMSLI